MGLIPVFPVRNISAFTSGGAGASRDPVFRDCVLMKKNATVKDVARAVVGDARIAFVETVGGMKCSEDDKIEVGKNDVSDICGF